MCQQAVEKLVKGLYVLYTGEEADRTHNIARVYNKIFNEDKNIKVINDQKFNNKSQEYMEFFGELLYYYIII